MRDKGGLIFIHGDMLGSASMTTDSNNDSKISEMRYKPFGEPRLLVNQMNTDRTFTGQRIERGFGNILDYGARYYDPYIGRFISADTIVPGAGNPQAFNRYAYVLNNPLGFRDPTGHDPRDDNGHSMNDNCNYANTGCAKPNPLISVPSLGLPSHEAPNTLDPATVTDISSNGRTGDRYLVCSRTGCYEDILTTQGYVKYPHTAIPQEPWPVFDPSQLTDLARLVRMPDYVTFSGGYCLSVCGTRSVSLSRYGVYEAMGAGGGVKGPAASINAGWVIGDNSPEATMNLLKGRSVTANAGAIVGGGGTYSLLSGPGAVEIGVTTPGAGLVVNQTFHYYEWGNRSVFEGTNCYSLSSC